MRDSTAPRSHRRRRPDGARARRAARGVRRSIPHRGPVARPRARVARGRRCRRERSRCCSRTGWPTRSSRAASRARSCSSTSTAGARPTGTPAERLRRRRHALPVHPLRLAGGDGERCSASISRRAASRSSAGWSSCGSTRDDDGVDVVLRKATARRSGCARGISSAATARTARCASWPASRSRGTRTCSGSCSATWRLDAGDGATLLAPNTLHAFPGRYGMAMFFPLGATGDVARDRDVDAHVAG